MGNRDMGSLDTDILETGNQGRDILGMDSQETGIQETGSPDTDNRG